MSAFNQYYPLRKPVLFLTETVLIFASITLATYLRLQGVWEQMLMIPHVFLKIALVTGVSQICLYYNDLYDFKIIKNFRELFFRLVQAIGVTSFLLGLVYAFLPRLIIGRGIFFVAVHGTLKSENRN